MGRPSNPREEWHRGLECQRECARRDNTTMRETAAQCDIEALELERRILGPASILAKAIRRARIVFENIDCETVLESVEHRRILVEKARRILLEEIKNEPVRIDMSDIQIRELLRECVIEDLRRLPTPDVLSKTRNDEELVRLNDGSNPRLAVRRNFHIRRKPLTERTVSRREEIDGKHP